MALQEQSATAPPAEVTVRRTLPCSFHSLTMWMAYSTPTPKMKGKAMKLRKVILMLSQPAMPTIQVTPASRPPMTSSAARRGRTRNSTSSSTAPSEAMLAIGPSRSTDRIIEAKMTAEPELSTSRPSGRTIRCKTAAMRRRIRPS